jgi:hypothetical protein
MLSMSTLGHLSPLNSVPYMAGNYEKSVILKQSICTTSQWRSSLWLTSRLTDIPPYILFFSMSPACPSLLNWLSLASRSKGLN